MTTWKSYARKSSGECFWKQTMAMWIVDFKVMYCDFVPGINDTFYGYVWCSWKVMINVERLDE